MTLKIAPTRTRLIEAAKALFQKRGYHGVGVADILAAADAPKGSLYHHFPGGKDEIAAAAVARIAADVSTLIALRRAQGADAGAILEEIGALSGAWLKRSRYTQGPLIAVMAQSAGPDAPLLRDAVRKAFADWREGLAGALGDAGLADAAARAAFGIAALEGALALARVERDVRVLKEVVARAAAVMRAA